MNEEYRDIAIRHFAEKVGIAHTKTFSRITGELAKLLESVWQDGNDKGYLDGNDDGYSDGRSECGSA